MKRILYDTGQRTVVRWPHKRRQKLEVVIYGEMTPDPPPQIEKNKFVLKCRIDKPVLGLDGVNIYSAVAQRRYPGRALQHTGFLSTTEMLISDWTIKRFNSTSFPIQMIILFSGLWKIL